MKAARVFVAAIVILALGRVSAAAVPEISGVYDNIGSHASVAAPNASEPVSFQGLLELNFNHAAAVADHSATARVVLRQTSVGLRIECLDQSGKVTWARGWERGEEYAETEDRIDLKFRAARLKYDSYLFSLKKISGTDLLLVEVYLVQATTLGPNIVLEGSYLFSRLPDKP